MKTVPKPPFSDRVWLMACAIIEERHGDPVGAVTALVDLAGQMGGMFRMERRRRVIELLRAVADRLEREPGRLDEDAAS